MRTSVVSGLCILLALACGGGPDPVGPTVAPAPVDPVPAEPTQAAVDAPTALAAILAGRQGELPVADAVTVRLYDYEVGDGWCARNLSVLFPDVAPDSARGHMDWMHTHGDQYAAFDGEPGRACASVQGDCEHLLCVEVTDGRVSALERDAPYE